MTLIVALKYKDGVVLASDSRVMYGPIKRDQARKLEPLTEKIAAAAAGLLGAIDDVLRAVKAFCSSRLVTFDDVVSYLSDVNYKWYEENSPKLEEGESGPVFIIVSPERIRRIFGKGYSEEAYDYACEGSGRAYGEYILRNFYNEELSVEEAKELAVYTIVETSKMDPAVGEDISMLILPKEGKCEPVDKVEIESIKERLIPLSRKISEMQIRTVEEIVKKRENINDLCKKKFGFKLFHPNEIAIFQIMKPCRNEEEFTHNIAALALLVDQLNVEEMKKVVGGKEGSVNILEAFLAKNLKEFPTEIISNFRDIITLRSKKFPIHVTDPKFVEVVIRICGKYPPAWTTLWLEALSMYKKSIDKLLECLQKESSS
jgi:proteasome beta subunit